jgi:hypothetical protein
MAVAASLGITALPCIVSTARGGPPPPDGVRLLTVEDVMARLANPPESFALSGPEAQAPPGRGPAPPSLVAHFHDFTRRRAVPHGPAEIAGRRGAEEERFGHLADVVRLAPGKPGSFCHGAWTGWRAAGQPTTVLALSGEAWLLLAGPDGPPRDSVRQRELRAGQEATVAPGERYCLRTYSGGGAELAVVPPGE